MNKKGAITWEQIIYAVIAVIVLVVLAWVFREYINEATGGFSNILKPVADESKNVREGLKGLTD